SLSVLQAARLLGVDASRVRQRLAAHTLYGLKVGRSWLLPRYQFDGERIIPGVEKVFSRLRSDLHPIAVYTWFTSPDPDLIEGVGQAPVSPRDWLRSGGDAGLVAGIAAAL